ncbi:MAG: helix-turn-helix domain-containing protein [Planctomycetes bacterium]|nr:helix-turn-helix domain-containing protein [Planctomycetota bacterium]
MEDDLMTAGDVAALLKVPKSWVFRASSEGRIPKIVISRRCVRFKRSDVEAMLKLKYKPARHDESVHP